MCSAPTPPPRPRQGVAELRSPSRRPLAGSRHIASAYTSVVGTSCLDRCLWSGHPTDAGGLERELEGELESVSWGEHRGGLGLDVRLVRQVRQSPTPSDRGETHRWCTPTGVHRSLLFSMSSSATPPVAGEVYRTVIKYEATPTSAAISKTARSTDPRESVQPCFLPKKK